MAKPSFIEIKTYLLQREDGAKYSVLANNEDTAVVALMTGLRYFNDIKVIDPEYIVSKYSDIYHRMTEWNADGQVKKYLYYNKKFVFQAIKTICFIPSENDDVTEEK